MAVIVRAPRSRRALANIGGLARRFHCSYDRLRMRNLLTDIPGIAVGHLTDLVLGSGTTAIVFDEAVTASGIILGGAPGSRETALLEPEMRAPGVHAFVFSGG